MKPVVRRVEQRDLTREIEEITQQLRQPGLNPNMMTRLIARRRHLNERWQDHWGRKAPEPGEKPGFPLILGEGGEAE